MSTQTSRLYPSVAAEAVQHHRWTATVTGAGAQNDVVTCLMQGARTIVITAAGAAATLWSFTHKGRSVGYTVIGGDTTAVVAAALLALINSRFPGELKAELVGSTIRMVVLDGSDSAPAVANSGAGTATNVAGAVYTVGAAPTVTTVAAGVVAALDLFPDITATNVAGAMTVNSASDQALAPSFGVVGTATVGAVAASAGQDSNGYGLQTVRDN